MVNYIDEKYFKMVNPNVSGNSLDWYCRCDICGDSAINKNKKRLHLYFKKGYSSSVVHCFNCGYSSSAYNYFKNIHPEVFRSYRNEIGDDIIAKLKPEICLDNLDEFDDLSVDSEYNESVKGCISLEDFNENSKPLSSKEIEYLKTRHLEDSIDYTFMRSGKEYTRLFEKEIRSKDFILIPLFLDKQNIFGYQARSIKEKRFLTILSPNFSGYKIFGLNNIDRSKPVFVFESIFDSLSSGLDNSLALLGLDLPDIVKDLDIIYCLDNQKLDKASRERTKRLAKQNKKLFVWKDEDYKDYNEMLIHTNKQEVKNMILNNIYQGLDAYIRL